jgi:hypothetical protein
MVHREREADFLRAAHKSELAAAVAKSRTSERRFYLAHLWEKRFGKTPRPAEDLS